MTAPLKPNAGCSIHLDAEQPPREAHAAHPALDGTRGDVAARRTSGFSADAATNIRSAVMPQEVSTAASGGSSPARHRAQVPGRDILGSHLPKRMEGHFL